MCHVLLTNENKFSTPPDLLSLAELRRNCEQTGPQQSKQKCYANSSILATIISLANFRDIVHNKQDSKQWLH